MSDEALLRVRLLHKPKGFGVHWRALPEDELIRVNDRGRALVIEITAVPACGEINWASLELKLIDTKANKKYTCDEKDARDKTLWEFKQLNSVAVENSPLVQRRSVKIYLRPTTVAFEASVTTTTGKKLNAISTRCRTSNTIPTKASRLGKEKAADLSLALSSEEETTEAPSASSPLVTPEESEKFIVNSNLKVEGELKSQTCIQSQFSIRQQSFMRFDCISLTKYSHKMQSFHIRTQG
jgi:hypothetical protein